MLLWLRTIALSVLISLVVCCSVCVDDDCSNVSCVVDADAFVGDCDNIGAHVVGDVDGCVVGAVVRIVGDVAVVRGIDSVVYVVDCVGCVTVDDT